MAAVTDDLLRSACALVDRSETGKLALTGPQRAEMLNGQVSNDVTALSAGEGQYAALLTPKGKMLGDLRILETGEELLILCERAALQSVFDALRRGALGWQVELHKRTLQWSLLSLVGPSSGDALGVAVPETEHANVAFGGGRAIRTDLGIDMAVPAEEAAGVREALGVPEAGETDAEVLRVESGRPRYGIDLDDSVIPQEAGLNERAVSFTKGCYTGQETVARLFYKGRPNRHLRGLVLGAPAATGSPVTAGDREVGRLGSVVRSPRLGDIALALLRREVSPGEEVTVAGTPARVTDLPFP